MAGANIFIDFLVWRAGTTSQFSAGEVRLYKLAGRLWLVTEQLHQEETTSSENNSEIREEPATVDMAGPKQ